MNVTFINTPLQDYGKVPKRDYYTTPPLGLGYLATVTKNLGNHASLIDAEAKGFSIDKTVRDGRTFPQFKLKDIKFKSIYEEKN